MRVTPGAICFSNSSHFALIPNSNSAKPVALPPGAAKFAANPAPTGSTTLMKTIGNVRVASWSAGTARLVLADPVAVAESLFNRQDYGKGSSTASAGSASHHCRTVRLYRARREQGRVQCRDVEG